MNNPLVSIIVPVYNVQNSVARCLESICAQTWKDIEVILVNDGSRDESFSICEQFREKDPRIVLVDKSNSGVSETRNCGMSLAKGKYVQFVDSDDYLDPDFTERLVTAAEANNADLVIAPYFPPTLPRPRRHWKTCRRTLASMPRKSLMISVNTASCPRASTTAIPLPCA